MTEQETNHYREALKALLIATREAAESGLSGNAKEFAEAYAAVRSSR